MRNIFLAIFIFHSSLSAQQIKLMVLGTAQDAGAPQINCKKKCCKNLWENNISENVVSLGIIDIKNKKHYLFEATPNITQQWQLISNAAKRDSKMSGIFLTHAHMGHYSGLLSLGKEALNSNSIPVYTLPRFANFLETNGPWKQLISEKNILLKTIKAAVPNYLSEQLKITALIVPHRDEYSETAAYIIQGPNKNALFIPDIDKWERWSKQIESLITSVDYAFIDATFYDQNELKNRNIYEIPHPFVIESIDQLNSLSLKDKNKVYFIHMNHTNPLLDLKSKATKNVISKGYNIARTGMIIDL